MTEIEPWRVSMHGGHSSEFSAHGSSTLEELLERAIERGLATYGVSNHALAADARFLYDDEVEAGLDLRARFAQFEAYAAASEEAARAYSGRLEVLRGFEAEVVPSASYAADMRRLRGQFGFEYVVGSVHWVDETPIDVSEALFNESVARRGGLEPFLVRYYELVCEMIEAIQPEVVAHLDLPRLFSEGAPAHDSRAVWAAIDRVLRATAAQGALLEVNTAAYRKGLHEPYPRSEIVKRAAELGVEFTFSDDSHHVNHVGAGLDEARKFLIANGVEAVGSLGRDAGGSIFRRAASLL
jgi:histidinol-phosphatase (PHP family)